MKSGVTDSNHQRGGIPIFVTLYLPYRIEAKLDLVVQSIQPLPERINHAYVARTVVG